MLISALLIVSVIMPCTNYASPRIGYYINLVRLYAVLLLFPFNLYINVDFTYSVLVMHKYLFV